MYRVVILDRRSSRVKYVRVGEYLTFDLCNRLSFYLGHEDTMTMINIALEYRVSIS